MLKTLTYILVADKNFTFTVWDTKFIAQLYHAFAFYNNTLFLGCEFTGLFNFSFAC